ncbi:sodium:proton antiporter NhaD, partial [uncultured Alistipes sp.]
GAMTIVEIVDANGGFNFVRDRLQTTSKRKLLWRITFMTFVLSAILDNLTTSIVMVMVLRKLVSDNKDRMIYAGLVILAANAGGAFSPIGDVTTIMLWIKGNISTIGVITEIFLPSVASVVVPALILQTSLKGELAAPQMAQEGDALHFTAAERNVVFWLGVGGLIFVPVFRFLTGLPPFMGILLVLGLLWTVTELFYRSRGDVEETTQQRVTQLLSRID